VAHPAAADHTHRPFSVILLYLAMKTAALIFSIFVLFWRESVALSQKRAANNAPSRRMALARILQGPFILGSANLAPEHTWARNLPVSTGAPSDQSGTVEALIPIARIRKSLDGPVSDLPYAVPREEQAFKRLFDAYSDLVSYKQKFLDQNAFLVYYTRGFDGPNRAFIEEELPEKQTLQYGVRNEAWIAWEELQVELDFQRNHPQDDNDVDKWLAKFIAAVDAYLQLAPPDDVKQAMRIIK
jgi:hypothetical protein